MFWLRGRGLGRALARAVKDSESPGAVAYVGRGDHTLFHAAEGLQARVPEKRRARKSTLYDLASLTKVVATATAAMLLHEDGALDLDAPVSDYVPVPEFAAFTTRHLLTHTSGMTDIAGLYSEVRGVDEMLQRHAKQPLTRKPGTYRQYCDIGFIVLGRLVELVGHDSLDAICRKRIFAPLAMNDTLFRPPKRLRERCAPTELCAWRRHLVQGEVHDENAAALGGVTGHAGLFSTAGDLARFCRGLLAGRIVSQALLTQATRLGQTPCWPWQGLGWQLDPWGGGDVGYLPSRTAFGHTGWTGTSLWMDRDTAFFSILLSNTCHPSRAKRDSATLRRTFHAGVVGGHFPGKTTTHTGLDRLVREQFEDLRGKHVGLLTHHAAVDQFGRHILDLLRGAEGVELATLFSPEHGLRGQKEAGATVASKDGAIPVVSLYGAQKAPTPEQLAGLDVLVIDLQDVGSRYYTYAATMKHALNACADNGTQVLVLDRPNPVGGCILEGPVARNTDSDVCWGAVPVRHGLTMGEIALFIQRETLKEKKLRLGVKKLDNWNRERFFDECGLPWVPPSPNIPTPRTALVYVGSCLFEGVNLNEGRGTDTPFLLVGAPWLDAKKATHMVRGSEKRGFDLEPVSYTPRSIPGKASRPDYMDERCQGIRITLRDPAEARPFTLVVSLLSAMERLHPGRLEWAPFFDVLAGSPALREAIQAGEPPRAIIRSCEDALAEFAVNRPTLYG